MRWPSMLSWPFSLVNLPSISLPANIQRRFLSYVLKRALGRFVKPGGLDVDRVQSQLSEGWVEIDELEVNTDEINELIGDTLPLSVISGTLDHATARIPFPNLWSDPLSITLDNLTLDLRLLAPRPKSKSREAGDRTGSADRPHGAASVDLAASVTIAADEFLHDELDAFEEAELDRSIRQSLVLSQTDPFVNEDVPGGFPYTPPIAGESPLPANVESKTALAGLVERVLARLQVKVRNIKVRINLDDRAGAAFELRIGEIRYQDETASSGVHDGSSVRALRFSTVNIFVVPAPSENGQSISDALVSSSIRSSSTSSDPSSPDTDDHAALAMSLGVADLRQSTMSSVMSGASVYQSALSEIGEDHPPAAYSGGGHSDSSDGTVTPPEVPEATSRLQREAGSGETDWLLFSLGSDDAVFRLTTTPIVPERPLRSHAPGQMGHQDQASSAPNQSTPAVPPAISLAISIGTVAIFLLPVHVSLLLDALRIAAWNSDEVSGTHPEPQSRDNIRPRIQAAARLSGFVIIAVYDMQAEQNENFQSSISAFWAKPMITYPSIGHLKFRAESIHAAYDTAGYIPVPAKKDVHSSERSRPAPRRSVTAANTHTPSSASIHIEDLSIFEYLATDTARSEEDPKDVIPGGAYPVLMFDAGLPEQYDPKLPPTSSGFAARLDSNSNTPLFPEFDTVDWRNSGLQKRAGNSEKAWKVRHKGRGVLKGGAAAVNSEAKPAVSITKDLASSHLLRYISPSIQTSRHDRHGSPDLSRSYRPLAQRLPSQYNPHYVIDDLDAQASLATLRGAGLPSAQAEVFCSMIRLDIRCPAPVKRRGNWGDGGHLRSGIVTLDLHRLRATLGRSNEASSMMPTCTPSPSSVSRIDFQKMIILFCRVPDRTSRAILVLGPLLPDPSEIDSSLPIMPVIKVSKQRDSADGSSTSSVTCRIPSVSAKILQSTIEGLQFFADDITHWLDGAFGDGSAPKPRDDLKMIGSRFFGSKGSSSASSSTVEDEDDGGSGAMVVHLLVTEVDAALYVPRKKPREGESIERILSLAISDLDAKLETNVGTVVTVSIMDAEFCDKTVPTSTVRIVGRTIPLMLALRNSPLIHLRFSSLTDSATGAKETDIKVICTCLAAFLNKDLAWVAELITFAKTPEGVFEDMTPAEVTRIGLDLHDCSLHVTPPTMPGAVVFVAGFLGVNTDITSEIDERQVHTDLSHLRILSVDDTSTIGTLQTGHAASSEAWKRAGYAEMVDVSCEIELLKDDETAMTIQHADIQFTACADSLVTFSQLLGDIPNLMPTRTDPNRAPLRSPTTLDQSVDVFGSVDEEAFRRVPDAISGIDLIEDDLPTNLDYLDAAAKRRPRDSTALDEGLRSWQTELDVNSRLAAELNGESIRILSTGQFDLNDGYWDELPVLDAGGNNDFGIGDIRVKLKECSVGIHLYDGYDWLRTRKAIEEEIKAVRRKLEKIRQLLAAGQKADDSIEKANTTLFNSVYIGLDQSKEQLDSAALIAAIDDELGDLGDETASQSSWQSFPVAGERPSGKRIRLRGKRLTRSKKAQIEIALSGVRADVDLYAETVQTAARLQVSVAALEILDHIKTSTWKKFLSEMRSDSRGNIRETGAAMVRLELVSVRPSLPDPGQELRLKAKILPIRLHVDQDALDFLKRFFSFQTPNPSAPAVADTVVGTKTAGPFFQYVEIFPVEIKLDYKPKRVDYRALREGRTIELMNFFHFEGAEMTLRHITLSGISGVTRLSTLLQDIWTPDVKANQLADVISGVSPIRSAVNVGSGVADLILLPIEQYRKDGRVARGMQRGTNSFVRSTAMEMMKLGARLATGTQVILEKAEGVLGGKFREELTGEVGGGGASALMESDDEGEVVDVVSRYANQPRDVREGVQAAYKSLSSNINSAAQTILAVPMEVYEGSSSDGSMKAVVRAVPIAVLRPMIGASEAVSKTLLGARNSLDPRSQAELNDKYK